jgi:hypothetical protein
MAFDLSTAKSVEEGGGGFDLSTAHPVEEIEQEESTKSPLSFLERGKFSFGNEPGRKAFLENKFPSEDIGVLPTGKFTVSGVPVDPEGFDVGDIADVADEIVRLGFQIKGASIGASAGAAQGTITGAPSGPAGMAAGAASLGAIGLITGGAAGRATGQGFVSQIGKEFGVREEEFIDVAKDIVKQGAFGAAGEAGGQLVGNVTKSTGKFLSSFFDKVKKKFSDPTVQNLFNFTAGVEKNSVARLQQRGAKEILTRENMSEESILNIAQKIQNGVKKARKARGIEVQKAKDELSKSGQRIEIINPKRRFNAELRRAEILDDKFQVKDPLIRTTDTGRDRLLNVKETLDSFNGKTINAKEAIRFKGELDDIIKFSQEGKIVVGTNEQRILQNLRGVLDKNIKIKSKRLQAADDSFSELAKTQDLLKTQLNLPSAEGFLKKVLNDKSPAFTRQKLSELDGMLFKKDKFLEQLKDVIAARDFSSGTMRGIRSGIFGSAFRNIGSLTGAGALSGGPVGALAGFGTGVAVSTPRTVGNLIKAQQSLGLGLGSAAKSVGESTVPTARSGVPLVLEQFFGRKREEQ